MYERILQDIITYLEKLIEDDSISVAPESNLMDDLSLSSLEILHSLLLLEEEYGIIIPGKYLKRIITVRDFAMVLAEIAEHKNNN